MSNDTTNLFAPHLPAPPTDPLPLSESLNRFAFDLFVRLCEESSGNLVYSPSSISTSLAMLLAGAEGQTRKELANVLADSMIDDDVHAQFRKLAENTRFGGVEFCTANRIWMQEGYQRKQDFLDVVSKCYGAEPAALDFANESQDARLAINRWIAEQTNGKIENLISPGLLSPLSRLIITNAVYFLGTWESPFSAERTRPRNFRAASGETTEILIMHQTDNFLYGEDEAVQLLELNYRTCEVHHFSSPESSTKPPRMRVAHSAGSDFAMTILLPRVERTIDEIALRIHSGGLASLPPPKSELVNVAVPRFRIEAGCMLATFLKAMGMHHTFSRETADFSRISDDPEGLFVDEVVHKAFIDVNEEGTEAAAATSVVLRALGAADAFRPREFIADRPFVFYIWDRATGVVHFLGRFEEPSDQ